uniref:Uncharacterized protein n=1 Tax=Mycena chlorophos TaxID=658473 RepID=A0ABQ0L3F3_MYCCL|nr:predicted protein [Mycena chlorophos]
MPTRCCHPITFYVPNHPHHLTTPSFFRTPAVDPALAFRSRRIYADANLRCARLGYIKRQPTKAFTNACTYYVQQPEVCAICLDLIAELHPHLVPTPMDCSTASLRRSWTGHPHKLSLLPPFNSTDYVAPVLAHIRLGATDSRLRRRAAAPDAVFAASGLLGIFTPHLRHDSRINPTLGRRFKDFAPRRAAPRLDFTSAAGTARRRRSVSPVFSRWIWACPASLLGGKPLFRLRSGERHTGIFLSAESIPRAVMIWSRGERRCSWTSQLRQEQRAAAVPLCTSTDLRPLFRARGERHPTGTCVDIGTSALPLFQNSRSRVLDALSRRSKDFAPRRAAPFLDSKRCRERRGAAAFPLFPGFDAARLGPAASSPVSSVVPRASTANLSLLIQSHALPSTARGSAPAHPALDAAPNRQSTPTSKWQLLAPRLDFLPWRADSA